MAPRAGLGHEPIPSHEGLSVWLWEVLGWVEDVEGVGGDVGATDRIGARAIGEGKRARWRGRGEGVDHLCG